MSKPTPADVARLIETATAAQGRARCAFSRFPVGASVLGASGRVYPGCNIESPTLIQHVCAERAAIFNAVSEGEASLLAVCTVSSTAFPCGNCRQAILEFVGADAPIYSVLNDPRTGRSRMIRTSARALLPHIYTEKHMKAGADPAKRRRRPRRS
jgi:cytidine deaminase